MAKFNTPIENSSFDPYAYEKQIEQLTGKSEILSKTPIANRDTSLNLLSGLEAEPGYSLLTSDIEASETINERKARDQGALELAGKSLYNIGNTVLFEVAKLPGYVGGIPLAIGDAIQGKENPIRSIVDNSWVNALDSMEHGMKELIPVHIQKSVAEGDLIDKISSGQWWASTGSEGVGYLLSMMIPGQALKLLGIGAKLGTAAEAIGNSSKIAGKLFNKVGLLEKVGEGSKFALGKGAASAIDSFSAATLNTFAESSAEAANTFDNVKSKAIQDGLTEEEANQKAGDAAASVFKANMAILINSNLLDEAWLWKGFSNVQKKASNKILDKIFVKDADGKRILDVDALKNLKGKGWRDALSIGASNFTKQAIKEGFFEEGMQTSLQQAIESGDIKDSTVENLFNAGKTYVTDFLNNTQLHESIFLGGILGGGMSAFKTASDIRNYNRQLLGTSAYNADGFFDKVLGRKSRKEQKGFAGLFSENYVTHFNSLLDIAEKDNEGKPIIKDGKIVVNEAKYAELAESKANLIDANLKYDLAVATGDKVAQDALSDVLTFNYLQPFLQQEGGVEVFKEHAPQITEAWANRYQQSTGREATEEQKTNFSNQLLSKAEEFNKLYREVDDTHSPERFVSPDNTEDYNEWREQLFNDKLNLAIQNRSIKKTKSEIDTLKKGIGEALTEEEISKLDPVTQATLKFYQRVESEIDKKQPELKKEYLDLFTKEGVKKHYEEFKEKRKKLRDTILESIKEEEEFSQKEANLQDQVELLKSSAESNGYVFGDDDIHLENEEGKKYIIKNENGTLMVYNEEGKSKKVNSSLLKNLKLKVIPKDQVRVESEEENIKQQAATELSNYRESARENSNLTKTNEEIKKITEEVKETIKSFEKLLDNTKVNNLVSFSETKKFITSLENIVDILSSRREHLIQLADIHNNLNTDESIIKEINALSENILSKLNKIEAAIDSIVQYLNPSFNIAIAGILSKNKEVLKFLNEVLPLTTGTSFQSYIEKDYKEKGLSEILTNPKYKDSFIRKLNNIIKDTPAVILREHFGKDEVTYLDVIYKLASKGLSSINTEGLNLDAKNENDLKNHIFVTPSEVKKLNSIFQDLSSALNLDKINKDYNKLENKLSKIESEFSSLVIDAIEVEDEHKQKDISREPSDNPESITDKFAERQLGMNLFPVAGLNILYEKTGKFAGFDVLEEGGLPKQNPSVYQQIWYKTIDEIATESDKYKLVIYNPKYDNSSDLEKQIGENNPNNRSVTDLFVILVDENGNLVKKGDIFVFTSLWKPEIIYGEKPRVAPDAFVSKLLGKIGVSPIPYKKITPNSFTKSEQAKINKYLNTKSFTQEDIYNRALEEARIEYTKWFDEVLSIIDKYDITVDVKGVTSGKPLQRRDEDRKIIWSNVLSNIPQLKLEMGQGTDKLKGGRILITPRSGKIVLSKNVAIDSHVGDTVIVLNDQMNLIPTKSRNITEDEAMLVMYLLSLGTNSIPLPKGVTYRIGNIDIKDSVNLFFYQSKDKRINAQLKNFSLLNTIINYGEKMELPGETKQDYNARNKGSIFVATNTKRIIYTDFSGKVKTVSISLVKKAFDTNDFSNSKVKELFEFLKEKRFNVSQTLLESNNIFPYPSLSKKINNKGNPVYEVNFDNSNSYYEFLLDSENSVLTTNIVNDKNYPQFVQRNLYFNPQLAIKEKTKTSEPVESTKKKKKIDDLEGWSIPTEEEEKEMRKRFDNISAEKIIEETKPIIPSPIQDVPEQLGKSTQQRLSKRSLKDLPKSSDFKNYKDKLYSPNELLEIKIQNGEIKQDCK